MLTSRVQLFYAFMCWFNTNREAGKARLKIQNHLRVWHTDSLTGTEAFTPRRCMMSWLLKPTKHHVCNIHHLRQHLGSPVLNDNLHNICQFPYWWAASVISKKYVWLTLDLRLVDVTLNQPNYKAFCKTDTSFRLSLSGHLSLTRVFWALCFPVVSLICSAARSPYPTESFSPVS